MLTMADKGMRGKWTPLPLFAIIICEQPLSMLTDQKQKTCCLNLFQFSYLLCCCYDRFIASWQFVKRVRHRVIALITLHLAYIVAH